MSNFDQEICRFGTHAVKVMQCENLDDCKEYIALGLADMDIAVAPVIREALHEVVDRSIYGYTSVDAGHTFKKSLKNWLKTRFDQDIEEEWVLYSNGSLEVLKSVLFAFTQPGDGVIIQRPVYGHFTQIIEDECHRKVQDARLLKDDKNYYTMDFDALEEQCSNPHNRVMVLCSPHNPVGRVWTAEELNKVLEICRKYDIILVSDEVHADLTRFGHVHTPILKLARPTDKVIQIMGIGKTFNCAGLQCANAIIPNKRLREQVRYVHGDRGINPFSLEAQVAAYSEAGAQWLDDLNDYLDETVRQVEDYFAKELPQVKISHPEGTYILWFDFSDLGLSPDEIHEQIYNRAKVILQDGSHHDPDQGQYFQRMCYPSPRAQIMEACKRIVKAFKEVL
jgi:cystathionine beta-lyase